MILSGNEEIEHRESSLIVRFPEPRDVLSTSWMNGGYRKNQKAIFNHQIPLEACEACHANGGVKTYLEGVAESLLLDPASTSGLLTRAEMKNAAIISESFRDLTVTAIVTAGIDKNGGRAGDPASYYENGDSFEPVGGTINTILLISADLPEYAMVRTMMTATEAKTAALQQLMARSIYSTGIATGSGTDMIAVVANPGSSLHVSDAGKHSKLGELIGKTVIAATQAALEMETGLSPGSQRDVLVRLSRFGVTVEDIWDSAMVRYGEILPEKLSKEKFVYCFREKSRDANLVSLVSAVLHIVDEATWNLLPEDQAKITACRVIRQLYDPELMIHGNNRSKPAQEEILSCLVRALADLVLHEINDGISISG
ncbi:adenosylcobinamide amidohydrolase [Methanoregula sp.]|uniref:adenosylcobinamide amidohydrolase n=1 Tax=Methanoregula sp. TaxID=2052170 RepID=UPI0035694E95